MTPAHIQQRLDAWVAHRLAIRQSRTRLGVHGYAHLAAILAWQPSTAVQLGQRAALGHMAAYRFLMGLYQLRRVHVAAWYEQPRKPLLPVFAFGRGVDAEAPPLRANGRPVRRAAMPKQQLTPALIAFEHLLRTIEVPATRAEVMDATGLDNDTVQAALQALHELELAHVPLWESRPQGGAPVPSYQLGAGRDAPRPRYTARRRLERQRELTALHRERGAPLQAALRLFSSGQSAGGAA